MKQPLRTCSQGFLPWADTDSGFNQKSSLAQGREDWKLYIVRTKNRGNNLTKNNPLTKIACKYMLSEFCVHLLYSTQVYQAFHKHFLKSHGNSELNYPHLYG